VSNNNEILDGLGDLLKNVDLEQFTSLLSNLNINPKDTVEKPSMEPQLDKTTLGSLISNIDLEEVRSLLSGLNFDYLKDLGLVNSNSDYKKNAGVFNIEELEAALYEVTKRMQNFIKTD